MSRIPSEKETKKIIRDSQPQMWKDADLRIRNAVRDTYAEKGVAYDPKHTSENEKLRYGKDRTITFSADGTRVTRNRNWQLVAGIFLVTVLFASAVVAVVYGKQRGNTTSVADDGKKQEGQEEIQKPDDKDPDGKKDPDDKGINTEISVHVTVKAGNGADLPAGLGETMSGTYHPGEEITLIARSMPGYGFLRWEVSDNVDCLDDPTKVNAVLTVPDRDITVTAICVQDTDPISLDAVTFREPPFTYYRDFATLPEDQLQSHRKVDVDYYPDVADDVLCGFVLVPAGIAKGHEEEIKSFLNREEEFLQFLQEEKKLFEDLGLTVTRHITKTFIYGEDRDFSLLGVCVVATKQQIRNVFGGEKNTKPYGNRYWMISGASREDFESENEVEVIGPWPDDEYSFSLDDYSDYWSDEELKEKVYAVIDSYTLTQDSLMYSDNYHLFLTNPALYEQLSAIDGAVPYILRWVLERDDGRGAKGALAVVIVAEILGKPLMVEESILQEGFQCEYMCGSPMYFAATRLFAEYYKKN